MKKLILLTLIIIGAVGAETVEASHAAGSEILYALVPNTTNSYTVTYKFYRYCGTNNASAPTSQQVCFWNDCNSTTFTETLPKISGPTFVSTGCPSGQTTCTNPTSVVPGYEEHVYQKVVIIPSQCNRWHMQAAVGARNPMDWMGGGNLTVKTTFNNTVSQNDNSPYFSVPPIPYACVNVPFTYNMGAIDVNGDSLFFESIHPSNSSCGTQTTNPVTIPGGFPAPPYSPTTNPIPCNNTFVLNSQTGAISMIPSHVGKGVITIRVTSYRNGQQIGTVIRDIQINVLICSPGMVPPEPVDSSSLVNAGIDSLGQVKACSGDSIFFCVTLGSTDTDAILVPYSNIAFSMPGATITYTGTYTDSIEACVSWPTTIADAGLHVLVLTLVDSSCKPPGILFNYSFSFPVFIDSGIVATGDTIICAGDSAQLHVRGGGKKTWRALPGGSPTSSLSCTTCDHPWAKPTLPTYYEVKGCDLDTVFVDIAAVPTLTITNDTTTCVNANLQLQVTAAPPGQQYDYLWTPSTFLSNTTIANPVMQLPTASTLYTVTVTPYGANGPLAACAATESVDVGVLMGFKLNPYDSLLCEGETTNITGTGTTVNGRVYNYAWNPGADATPPNALNTTILTQVPGKTYTITASYPGCPDSFIVVPLIMEPIPVVDAGVDRELCLNDTIHLHSTVSPDTVNYTITWSPGNYLNSSTIADPVYRGVTTQTLQVIYATTHGCSDTDIVNLVVNNVDFLQLDGDRTLCPGDTATLSALGAISYAWSPNYYISNTGNVTNVKVYPPASQQYRVIGINDKGCYDTLTANVKVFAGSVVDAGDDVTIYPGESVTLYADGNCSQFNWFPPSGLSSTTVKNPIAQPTATTRYYVDAQTENGCPTRDSVTVIVSAESLIDLPNAFSPGSGTSVNDLLQIRTRGEVTLKRFDIMNRWGQKVFSTTNISEGWDGRFNNEPQPIGVYVYVIDAVTSSGKRFTKQGNITLVR